MHHDAPAVSVRGDLHHLGVGEARHVIHDGGSQANAHAGDVGVARVHGDDGPLRDKGAHHRDDPLRLLLRGDGGMPGPRRLAAHVNDVRALVEHLKAARDGGLGVEVFPAVREGVRRDVKDAHDARARE